MRRESRARKTETKGRRQYRVVELRLPLAPLQCNWLELGKQTDSRDGFSYPDDVASIGKRY